jgi:hypothetical protein
MICNSFEINFHFGQFLEVLGMIKYNVKVGKIVE